MVFDPRYWWLRLSPAVPQASRATTLVLGAVVPTRPPVWAPCKVGCRGPSGAWGRQSGAEVFTLPVVTQPGAAGNRWPQGQGWEKESRRLWGDRG